jgi:hypothetical protein
MELRADVGVISPGYVIARAGASAVRIVTAVVVAGLLWLGVESQPG